MRRLWQSFLFVPVVVGLAIAGCERVDDPTRATPASPQQQLGLLSSTQGYTPVEDPLVPGLTQSLSTGTLIGVEGGDISVLGHSLVVPAGAVSQPTLFSITVLPTGYVEVDLSATVTTSQGEVVDVGSKGFAKPVPVTLTYSRATNVSEPRKLTILRINSLVGYHEYEVMPSRVDSAAQTVTTELDHFSRYIVAYPN